MGALCCRYHKQKIYYVDPNDPPIIDAQTAGEIYKKYFEDKNQMRKRYRVSTRAFKRE